LDDQLVHLERIKALDDQLVHLERIKALDNQLFYSLNEQQRLASLNKGLQEQMQDLKAGKRTPFQLARHERVYRELMR